MPELPSGARWLNDHYQAILLEQQEALLEQQRQTAQRAQRAASGGAPAEPQPGSPEGIVLHDQHATQDSGHKAAEGAKEGPTPARHDRSRTSVR